MPQFSIQCGDIWYVRFDPSEGDEIRKVRPAVVVNAPHVSKDVIIVPLTSRLTGLLKGEFILKNWQPPGLNVASAVKRGLYTVEESLIVKTVGQLAPIDQQQLELSLREWPGF